MKGFDWLKARISGGASVTGRQWHIGSLFLVGCGDKKTKWTNNTILESFSSLFFFLTTLSYRKKKEGVDLFSFHHTPKSTIELCHIFVSFCDGGQPEKKVSAIPRWRLAACKGLNRPVETSRTERRKGKKKGQKGGGKGNCPAEFRCDAMRCGMDGWMDG